MTSLGLGVVSQAVAFVVGILIVRTLDRTEYAAYALCGAIAGAVVIIADSGINSTLMSASAPVQHLPQRLGALYAAALGWRRLVWLVVVLPACGLLTYLLVRTGVPASVWITAVVLTAVTTFSSLTIGLAGIELQLTGRIARLQRYDVINALVRLALVGLASMLRGANVLVYLGVSIVINTLQARLMLRDLHRRVPKGFEPEPADRALFGRAVRSTAAAGVFLVIGEQLVSVVLVQRHNPLAIADIAALSRFALAFGLVNVVTANLAGPLAARAARNRADVRRVSLTIVAAYLGICALFVLGTWLFDDLLLSLLGPHYDHLRTALIVVAAGAALTNFATTGIGIVLHARGWVAHSWTYGPFLGVWLIIGLTTADVSTTLGACMLSASLALPLLASNIVRFAMGYRSLPKHRATEPADERIETE